MSSEPPPYAQCKSCVHWNKIALFENCCLWKPVENNQLTIIADQWTGSYDMSLYWKEFSNIKSRKQAFTLDKGHKLVANQTFGIYLQCLERHLDVLHTLSLSPVSTGLSAPSLKGISKLPESSLKVISKHTLIQANCLWFVFKSWKWFFWMTVIG